MLKSVGLAYVPELTQDTQNITIIFLPTRHVNSGKLTNGELSVPGSPATISVDKLAKEVADLGIKERPSPLSPTLPEHTMAPENPVEQDITTLAVPRRLTQVRLLDSEASLVNGRPRSYSSDSGRTPTETMPVFFTEHINSICTHIANPFSVPSLILRAWPVQEIAGFSGLFTKKIKNELEWERFAVSVFKSDLRMYFRVPERHVPGPDPGYGTISIVVAPPLSAELPAGCPIIIYIGGILPPKEHSITRWQIDELADPTGSHKWRIALVNLRG